MLSITVCRLRAVHPLLVGVERNAPHALHAVARLLVDGEPGAVAVLVGPEVRCGRAILLGDLDAGHAAPPEVVEDSNHAEAFEGLFSDRDTLYTPARRNRSLYPEYHARRR